MKISALRIGLLGWLAVILVVYIVSIYFMSSFRSDYAVLYASTQFLIEGKNIYASVPVDAFDLTGPAYTARTISHPNLNPPFFSLMLSPLGLMPYPISFRIWSALSLGFGVLGVILLQRSTGQSDIDYRLILLLLLFGYYPVLANSLIGQTALLVFALVAGGWVAARSGRDRLSGLLLGLAFSIKLFLGLFLVCFLVLRRWRLLFWLLGTFVLCFLAGLAALGTDAYVQYWQALGSVTWQSNSWNASAYGFFSRIFGGSENPPLFDFPVLGKVLYYAFALSLVAALVWLGRSRRHADPVAGFDLTFSFTLVAALLISPLGWIYYFPLLLIPFFVLFRLARSLPFSQIFMGLLLTVFGLSGYPQIVVAAAETKQIAFGLGAFYFYALVALAIFIVAVSYTLQQKGSGMISKSDTTISSALERTQLLYGFLGLVAFYIVVGLSFLFV